MIELIKNAFSDIDGSQRQQREREREREFEERRKKTDFIIRDIDFSLRMLAQQRDDLTEKVAYLERKNERLLLKNYRLSLDLEKLTREQTTQNKEELKQEQCLKQDQHPNDNEEWELIQRHRQRAPEFEALIQTLIHHSKEYDSNKQPLKKAVAETFKEKTNMTANTRRAEEVARILGLPEENNQ